MIHHADMERTKNVEIRTNLLASGRVKASLAGGGYNFTSTRGERFAVEQLAMLVAGISLKYAVFNLSGIKLEIISPWGASSTIWRASWSPTAIRRMQKFGERVTTKKLRHALKALARAERRARMAEFEEHYQ